MCRSLVSASQTVAGSAQLTIQDSKHTCQWCRYAAISGAARSRRGAKGRRVRDRMLATLVTEQTSVEFTDSDGDLLLFKRNADGSLDYYANGVLQVRNLTRLRLSGVGDYLTVHIVGEAVGPWPSVWSAAVPQEHMGVVERAVALFEDARRDALTVFSDTSSDSLSDSSGSGQLCRCHSALSGGCADDKRLEVKRADGAATLGGACLAWLAPYCQWCSAC